MIRINLLPHREEKRKAKRQQFYGLLGLVSILAVLVAFLVYTIIDGYVSAQNAKNDFLKKEIAVLDKQIDQIKRLKEQTQALLARKQIIESLQRDRAEAVHLLSEVVKQMPEGIYIRSLKQDGTKISLIGYAQSNARVSTLMRNIEASQWLERPQLIEIKAVTVDKRRLNEFSMNAAVKRVATKEPGKK
ncbi:PilN domain-containing protein [Propionivibrio sp.]|jgi:type IV pilus assembly protein PilN|uniref:PilN domain-containing protein n=1 Tax=Propionivibrio sp. TaxID=2212460 RepID=UPI00272E99DC|nr:PilN domain-containing protein [Propionivibrio sp.]